MLSYGGKKDIEIADRMGRYPLNMASEQLDYKSVEVLLKAATKPNAKGVYGKTPIQSLLHAKKIFFLYEI